MGAIGFNTGGELLVNSHPLQTGFKNHIIDGRFDFWYEGTSQTASGYGSDTMWFNVNVGSTKTHTRQSFAVGDTFPDGTLCPMYYSRTVVSSVTGAGNQTAKRQSIENVTRLAGKTVTLSFYAKADSSKKLAVAVAQIFGSGGTPSSPVVVIFDNVIDITSTWTKYTKTFALPSISGKTLGTDGVHTSYTNLKFYYDAGTTIASNECPSMIQQSGTFDIAMVQLEEGSTATEFEWNGIGVEESRVGRYYEYRNTEYFRTPYTANSTAWELIASFVFATPKRTNSPLMFYSIATINQSVDKYRCNTQYSGTPLTNTIYPFNWAADARL